jgi:hypothetical protein
MKIKLRFVPHMPGGPEWCEVDAKVIGDLAVYRPIFMSPEGDLSLGKGWRVSHIPSGMLIDSAAPSRLKYGSNASQKDLIAWASAWQKACPEFFEAIRPDETRSDALKRLAGDAIDVSRSL